MGLFHIVVPPDLLTLEGEWKIEDFQPKTKQIIDGLKE